MSPWKVRKRDGAWLAIDANGRMRYASSSWRSVVDFALLGSLEESQLQRIQRIMREWPMNGRLW